MAQLDNIPAMLQSGEYVVRKEAVDKLGKNTMDMINNADRLGYAGGGLVPQGEHGHSAIDELLALNTLSNQRGVDMTRDSAMMNKGGKVLPSFINGIDSRDIRSVLTQFSEFPEMAVQGIYEMNEPSGRGKRYYSGKGQVPSSRVSDLEKAFEMALMNAAKSQKEFPQDSIPLSSVLQMLRDPEVKGDKRSIDGMNEGGMMDSYMYGGMSKKKKKKGYEDGGSVGVVDEMGKARKMFSELDEILQTAALMDRYDFGSSQRGALSALREADVVDPKEAVQQVMMLLNAREKGVADAGPYSSRKGYLGGGYNKRPKGYREGGYSGPGDPFSSQEGAPGSTPSSNETGATGGGMGAPSLGGSSFLDRAFELYGGRPEDEDILNRVTELYDYDPSIGAGQVSDLTMDARSQLTSFLPSVQEYGGGFEGFGGRKKAEDTARLGAYTNIDRAATDIASTQDEQQLASLIAYLTQLETTGGVKFT